MEENPNEAGQFMFITTAMSALISISDIQQIVSIGAGLMAITCGVFTSIYYFKKTKTLTKIKSNEKD